MVLDAQQLSLFDYTALDTDTRLFVQEKAQAIHTRLKRTAEDIIAIGQDLIEVKERLQHGQFKPWLQSEFQMSYPTAINFMRVAERFGKNINFIHLPISVLYELAAPSTPETVIEMVEIGQIEPTLSAIRETKRELQQEQSSLTQAETQAFAPQPAPLYGPVYQSPVFTPPTQHVNSEEAFKEKRRALEEEGFYYIPEQKRVFDAIDAGIIKIDLDEDEELLDEIESEYVEVVCEPISLPYEEVVQRRGVPAALQMSESNEWYTPTRYVEAARTLMGGIDIDPAGNAYANEKVVHATTFYDIQTNGLTKDWTGRIWLNPPYGMTGGESNQELWSRRLIGQFEAGITREAVLLVNANTEAKWFQPLYHYPICFTDHRIRFYNTSGESSQPTQGNAFIYMGRYEAYFIELFQQFGTIVRRIDND